MKKLLFIFLFFHLYLNSFSQLKTPFPDSTGAWTVLQTSDWPPIYNGFKYYISGDTLINSLLYNKVYCSPNTELSDSSGAYKGAFRQDSLKIYYIGDHIYSGYVSDSSEFLMYDFGMNINDSIPAFGCFFAGGSGHIKVESMDSVLLNGNYYRRWNFYPVSGFTTQWIEGIGSYNGFFPYYYTYCPVQDAYDLSCFHEDGQDYIVNSWVAASCETVGINEEINPDEILIFPNPASDQITIRLVNNGLKSEVFFTDITGKIVKEIFPDNKEILNVSVSDLKAGIYFVKTGGENFIQMSKIIIQH